MAAEMRFFALLFIAAAAVAQAEIGKPCHPMKSDKPTPLDWFNCHRDCNVFTEWCVPNNASSTGWACDHKHERGEAKPGQACAAGGGTPFCSNCPRGYFCQDDGSDGYECDVLASKAIMEVVDDSHNHSSKAPQHQAGSSALCSPCVDFSGQGLNVLLNYILNVGVVGGCGQLCSHLKTRGAQEACDLVCGVVGIKAFTKALNNTDLDPIYFCEVLHACAAGPDDAAMDILSVTAQPTSISKGDTIELSVLVNVTSASGVGEFGISVLGPVTHPVAQTFLLPNGIPVGQQSLSVKLQVQDDESGDFPVIWSAGNYQFTFEVCQGECHSKHPHSKYFGIKASNFTLTEAAVISI